MDFVVHGFAQSMTTRKYRERKADDLVLFDYYLTFVLFISMTLYIRYKTNKFKRSAQCLIF